MLRTLSGWIFLWYPCLASEDAHAPQMASSEPGDMGLETSDTLSLLQTKATAGARVRVNTKLMMDSDAFQGFRWTQISSTAACEANNENISRQASEAGLSLAECKDKCLHFGYCMAIDYYEDTRWCNVYDAVCTAPTMVKEGSSSYRLEIFLGQAGEKTPSPLRQPVSLGQLSARAVVPATAAAAAFAASATAKSFPSAAFKDVPSFAQAVQVRTVGDKLDRIWTLTSAEKSCEENDEGIQYLSHASGYTLESCKASCMSTRVCAAIDFYFSSGWCLLYDKACKNPKLAKDGGHSYSLSMPPREQKAASEEAAAERIVADKAAAAKAVAEKAAAEKVAAEKVAAEKAAAEKAAAEKAAAEKATAEEATAEKATAEKAAAEKAAQQAAAEKALAENAAAEQAEDNPAKTIAGRPVATAVAQKAVMETAIAPFPTPAATIADVGQYMHSINEAWAAEQMKADGIDGEAFQMLRINDLREYGLKKGPALKLSQKIEKANYEEQEQARREGVLQEHAPPVRSNALHDVVGPDGVLMISLDRRPERFQFSSAMLRRAGINAVKFSATDRTRANNTELARGCRVEGEAGVREQCVANGRTGFGCKLNSEQAIATSHLRALLKAQQRKEDWTAIFEDDVVPNPVEGWSDLFRKVWERVPPHIRMVRLGYCQFDVKNQPVPIYQYLYANVSGAVLTQYTGWGEQQPFYYEPGGCTSAYLVHKEILPDLIKLFPCCGAVDSCYKWDFFKTLNPKTQLERGMEILMNIDSPHPPVVDEEGNIQHHGLIVQDKQSLFTSRLSML